MSQRYPRTCHGKAGPHLINGPDDELTGGRKDSTCRECRRVSSDLFLASAKGIEWVKRYTENGGAAESRARSRRRKAEERDNLLEQELTRGKNVA